MFKKCYGYMDKYFTKNNCKTCKYYSLCLDVTDKRLKEIKTKGVMCNE